MSIQLLCNGIEMPIPDGFTYDFQEISSEDSGRVKSGLMNKRVIAKKRSIKMVYTLRASSVSMFFNDTTGVKSKIYVDLTYPDPLYGDNTTKNFYSGDIKFEHKATTNGSRWTFEVEFIER